MKRVYVVAWHYEGGAGFDWYKTAKAADKAFEEEKKNCKEFKADEWEAYRFDYEPEAVEADEITSEIDSDLDYLCVGKKATTAINRKTYRA